MSNTNEVNQNYILNGVTALYPRLDRTYRYDSAEQKSVPCDALEDGAEYSTKFKMDEETAKQLYAFMRNLYNSMKKANWPEYAKPNEVFTKDEDGSLIYKASLKGAYNGEKTKKPAQYDAKVKALPDDFQLTTGSLVNLAVVGIPYSAKIGAGVSLRLRGVQVLKLAAKQEKSPFDAVDGFSMDEGDDAADNLFAAEAPVEVEATPAPKAKPKAAAKPAAVETEVEFDLDGISFDD